MVKRALLLWLCLCVSAFARELEVLTIVGPVTQTTCELWFQTREPRTVDLLVVGPGGGAFSVDTEEDAIGKLRLTDLQPGTRYEVRVTEPQSWLPITFQTQPLAAGDFMFAFGSCCYVNDPTYAQGENGGEYQIYDAIAGAHPDFMLWLGDNVYYRHGDWDSEERMRARFRTDRWRLSTWWPVFAGTSNYAIWDDHDFGPNNGESNFPGRETALRIMRSVWPTFSEEEPEGAYYKFNWEDVDFFMLDDRYHRSHPEGVMFGPEQMAWLKAGLLQSKASFKFIVAGSQMLNPMVTDEAWAEFPRERQEFLDWLQTSRVEGVVFLTGDRHSAELIRLEGGYPLYDFTSSPLNSSLHRQSPEELANPHRVPGTSFDTKRNYGLARVSGPVGDRSLVLECRDSDGELIWSQGITQRSLRFQP